MKKHRILAAITLLLTLALTLCACGETVSVIGTHYDAEGNLILEMSDGSIVNGGRYETPDDNPQGLDFHLMADGTYAVSAGNAGYLKEITVPATYRGKAVTKIPDEAFAGCTLLHIDLPDTITEIGESAFFYSNLSSINLPQGLTVIEQDTFAGCHLLTITIPESVTSIKSGAFRNCNRLIEVENLSALEIEQGDPDHRNGAIAQNALNVYTPHKGEKKTFITDDGYVFYADDIYHYLIGYTGSETELTLPADCRGESYSIYRYAFAGNTTLTKVTCPNAVTRLWGYAFLNCTALESVVLPDTLTDLGSGVFAGCESLAELNIPSAVTHIDHEMFRNCDKLIELEDNVFYVDKWAIKSQGLDQKLRPDTVGLGTESLLSWEGSTLILPDTLTAICKRALPLCNDFTLVVVPASVKHIEASAFGKRNILYDIYYEGTPAEAEKVFAYADLVDGATLYTYSETAPTEAGNFWHYVDGEPTPW